MGVSYWLQGEDHQNFGDFLAELLVSRLFVVDPTDKRRVYVIGSNIDDGQVDWSRSEAGSTVFWGCGIRKAETPLSAAARDRVEVRAVRGPRSRVALELSLGCPVGDPGLLVPYLYTPSEPRGHAGSLLVPHIGDTRRDDQLLKATGAEKILRPRVRSDISALTDFIDAVCAAEFVLCGAMHAAVIAAAYGVPFAFYRSPTIDIPIKWLDFAESLSVAASFAATVEEGKQQYAAIKHRIVLPRLWPLLAVAPFPLRQEALDAVGRRELARLGVDGFLTHADDEVIRKFGLKLLEQASLSVARSQKDVAKSSAESQVVMVSKVAELEQEVSSLRAAAEAMRNSTSWRITKPLRRLADLTRKKVASSSERASPVSASAADGDWVFMLDMRIPLPDNNGGALRAFEILSWLRRCGFKVFYASAQTLGEYHWVLKEPASDIERYQARLTSMGVEFAYGFEEINAHLTAFGSRYTFAWMSYPGICFSYMPAVRLNCPRAKVIFDSVDLHFLRLRRQAELTGDPQMLAEAEQMERIERILCAEADVTVAISTPEAQLIAELVPGANVAVIGNIHAAPAPSDVSPDARRSIMFLGHYLHAPNADAAIYFVTDIFPHISRELPDVRFQLVGSNPTEPILALQSHPGVDVIGYVETVEPSFAGAKVFVAPLRFGAGVKGKIGQAMALGVPVVTTAIGAEGMGLMNGQTALIAEDPIEFAAQVVRLYRDNELWERLSAAAREHIRLTMSPLVAEEALRTVFGRGEAAGH